MGMWDLPAQHYVGDTELRFNPYHDPTTGRFTTANGGGGMGGFLYSKGGKSALVFNVNKGEDFDDEEYEKWKSSKSNSKSMTMWQDPSQPNIPAYDEDEWLSANGYNTYGPDTLDLQSIGHSPSWHRTEGQKAKEVKEWDSRTNAYYKQLDEGKAEYSRQLSSGKIRKPTGIERSIRKANGNPDLDSTQAARRMAKKRGYDWQTGARL